MSGRWIAAVTAGATLFLWAGAAQAVPVAFYFTGVIDEVEDAGGVWGGQIQPGSVFSGNYTFDSEAPPRIVDPNGAVYDAMTLAICMGSEALDTVATGATPCIDIVNASFDHYHLAAYFDSGRFKSVYVWLTLIDSTGQAFSDTDLPLAPPALSLFQQRTLEIGGRDDLYYRFKITGTVTTLTPEPTSLSLLLLVGSLVTPRRSGRTGSCKS